MFIAVYEGYCGSGNTLEKAYEDLCREASEAKDDRESCLFYEATTIDVEFKIIKKSKPVEIKGSHDHT